MLHQFADSIQGSLAEQGVAKYLNTYFASHVNTFTMPDLMWKGKKIQVRCQKPKENMEKVKDIKTTVQNEIRRSLAHWAGQLTI